MQHQWTFLSTSLIMLVATVRSYPTGAPAGACDAMFPTGHGVEGQTSAFPFNMTVSSQIYCPGWEIDVTVSGGTFKGFICQPRPNINTYETFGTLTSNNTFGTTNNCQGVSCVAH